MPLEKNKPNIAVVAIAKNEAPYIHEWLHHYEYFKFAKMFIGLNRTTDSTAEVIANISQRNKRVFVENMDWIDKGNYGTPHPDIQQLTYAYFSQKIADEHPEITDILYVDIDEFWFPSNFKAPIWRWLSRMGDYDIVSFNWVMQAGDHTAFEKPFENLAVTIKRSVKSLINVKAQDKIKAYRCHVPMIFEEVAHVNHKGKPIHKMGRQNNQKVPGSLGIGAFILHRTMRSEPEYLNLLQRENPEGGAPIKDNRFGFNCSYEEILPLEKAQIGKYHESLEDYISTHELSTLLQQARAQVLLNARDILNQSDTSLLLYFSIYDTTLQGTAMQQPLIEKIHAIDMTGFSVDETQEINPERVDENIEYVEEHYPDLLETFVKFKVVATS